jgi:hypothetical protein
LTYDTGPLRFLHTTDAMMILDVKNFVLGNVWKIKGGELEIGR